jgi:hypothetical protein
MTSIKVCGKRLLTDWVLRQAGDTADSAQLSDIKVSSFPTTVHVELLKLGKIPDPVRSELIFFCATDFMDLSAVCWVA